MLTPFVSPTLAFSLEHLLFEKPWPIVVTLALVWAVMRLVGVRLLGTEREALGKRMRTASWGVLLIAGLVLGVAWYVQTPRERMSIAMRQLLQAVEEEDLTRFDQLTAEDATGSYFGNELNRAQIDTGLSELTFEDITLLAEVDTFDAEHRIGVTRVRLRVEAEGSFAGLEGMPGLDISVWSILWHEREDGQWIAVRFEHEGSGLDMSIEDAE